MFRKQIGTQQTAQLAEDQHAAALINLPINLHNNATLRLQSSTHLLHQDPGAKHACSTYGLPLPSS